ncbi:nuclear transport factor 2 family protein [Flavobacterium alkalisoli]|uniref:Nuclear transport factor 2 family protein n=1 Tax=Flavobacterium alkalisoli TaxID=2602769 RepID=A0A5B9FQI0_9FLAO|nr:nuclear transport factor 2 family protein [Flavobacterium alkalisoli]QEE49563.1 nuclear transport factor 2 family protein [Flavobacterium alkalisoli]
MKNIIIVFVLLTSAISTAQDKYPQSQKELKEKIIALDSKAFEMYNTCNLEQFSTFFTEDLEFYHDKAGYSKGLDKLIESMRNYICNDLNKKVLRKPLTNTFKVYPLEGYGAILTGEHEFYMVENNSEKKTGTAKFTHVWLLIDGTWKMSRILSYDHKATE